MNYLSCLLIAFLPLTIRAESNSYVIGRLLGQAGNCFFQIAAVSALAWDNGVESYFPDLAIVPKLTHHYFSRCKISPPSSNISCEWRQPGDSYSPIPYISEMEVSGYLQSWKYFHHWRERLLTLFAPTKKDYTYIEKKYNSLLSEFETVGVQIRYYLKEAPSFSQFGRDYLEKAMDLFPSTVLFVVSSNNIDFAKSQIPSDKYNVIFLENENDYIEFYILTKCNHVIITNSTFGWWAAYLNTSPDKKVICPAGWFGGNYPDIYPEEWIQIFASRILPDLTSENVLFP